MTALQVMRCIRDARHNEVIAGAVRCHDQNMLMQLYTLSARETVAISACDVRWLTDYGVHPFSLVQLSRVLGVDLSAEWSKDRDRPK
jgi:hypothetical protein